MADEVKFPAIGEVVLGKYRLERVIGAGGMGFVFACRHLEIGELVAIKLLNPRAAGPDAVERFVREARATARLRDEHVVRVLDASRGDEKTLPYILMEYLEGEDLGALLRTTKVLPTPTAVDYVLQACEALAEAHALGIVHRDIKPSNLLLTTRPDGSALVKVLDFGISKSLDDGAQNPSLTDTQAVFGSPAYMSPEQIRSAKHVDLRSDVWSLGVVLFELLTGTLPFTGDTTAGLLAAIAADQPLVASRLRSDVPVQLDAALSRCLEKDRSRRFQTVAELASALRPFASRAGSASADVVERIDMRPKMGSLIPPATSSHPAAYSATERAVVTTFDRKPRGGGGAWIALVAAGAVVFLAGAGALVLLRTSGANAGAQQISTPRVTEVVAIPAEPSTQGVAAAPPPTFATATASAAPTSAKAHSPPVDHPKRPSGIVPPQAASQVAKPSAAPVAAPPAGAQSNPNGAYDSRL